MAGAIRLMRPVTMRRLPPAHWMLLGAIAFSSTAAAGNSPRIVFVGKQPADRVVKRVAAELGALGFEVLPAPDVEESTSFVQMEAAARSFDAIAAVRMVSDDDGIDLYVINARTKETVIRRVTAGSDSTVTALRSSEALRATLVDLDALVPATPSSPSVAAQPREREPEPAPPTAPRRAIWGVEFALGAATALESSTMSWLVLGGVEWTPVPSIGVHAFAVGPVSSSSVEGSEGRASVSFGLFGLGIGLRPWPSTPWAPEVGAGLAAALVPTRGTAASGFAGHSQVDGAAVPYVCAGFGIHVSSSWRVRTDALAGWAFPRPVVWFADRRVAQWGAPLAALSLGIEYLAP